MANSKIVYGNQVLMDLTSDTVEASKLLNGYTAHGKDGELVTGSCTYDSDTSDATASSGDILEGTSAYSRGNKLNGSMPNRGSVAGKINNKTDIYTIQSGHHDGSGTVSIDSVEQAKIIAGNIKAGVSILGVEGNYTGEGGEFQSKTATPYTDKANIVLPDEGYDGLSQVTVEAIYYNESPNAAGGTTVTIGTVSPA